MGVRWIEAVGRFIRLGEGPDSDIKEDKLRLEGKHVLEVPCLLLGSWLCMYHVNLCLFVFLLKSLSLVTFGATFSLFCNNGCKQLLSMILQMCHFMQVSAFVGSQTSLYPAVHVYLSTNKSSQIILW
jgi:hypothetical protein